MTTRKTDEAVVEYRKLVTMEFDVDQQSAHVAAMVMKLDADEMAEYVKLTMNIDQAEDRALNETERMKPTTAKAVFRRAVHSAGRSW